MGERAEKTNTEQTGGESKAGGGNPAPGEKKDAPKVSLKKNAIYNLISKLLAIITPFITTPYLARVLGEEGNGQISYVSSIIAYFTLAASLGFSVYGQREIAKCQDDREQRSLVFWEIFTTKVILTCLSLAVLAVLIFVVGFGENYDKLMMIMSLQVVAVIFDIEYLYMGEENFKSIAIRNMFVRIAGVVLILIFVRTENDVWIYALYLSLSSVFSFLIMWIGLKRYIGTVSIKKLRPWRHLKGSLIIFFPLVITSLFTTFDKTMIGLLSVRPDYDNGCYEQAYKINSIAQTFILLFSSIMMSRNTYAYKNGRVDEMNANIYKTSRYVWLTSLYLVAGFMVLSENFCGWFLGDGYVEVPLLLYIMTVRLLVSGFSAIFGDRFVAMGKEKYWMLAVLAGAISNIGLNAFMIPICGAIGAAVATAVCEVMILVIMLILTIKMKGLSVRTMMKSFWKYLIAAAEMFCIMFIMRYFIPDTIWAFFVIGGAGTIVYVLMLTLLRDDFFIGLVRSLLSKVFVRKKGKSKR